MEKSANKYKYLENVRFQNLECVNVWKLFYCNFRDLDVNYNSFQRIKRWLSVLMKRAYDIDGTGDIAFIYTSCTGLRRQDHLRCFNNISETQSARYRAVIRKRIGLNSCAIKNAFRIAEWTKQAEKAGMDKSIAKRFAVQLCCYISEAEYIYKRIRSADIVLTYCDALPVDYYITWLANNENKKTVTVEHGMFPKGSFIYENSESQYFIANSIAGKLFGEDTLRSKVLIGGLMQEFDYHEFEEQEQNKKATNTFAVLLDSGLSETAIADNKSVLALSEQFSVASGMRYIVRYHPADRGNVWHNAQSKMLIRLSESDETSDELMDKVDFSIMISSTTYFQSLFKLTPVIRYIGKRGNIFEPITEDVFSDYDSLCLVANQIQNQDIIDLKEKRQRWIGDTNVFEGYKRSINEIRKD